jgi:multidrug transporter EmrE-like cation transporter
MTQPWFNEQWAFLPGTLLGGVGGALLGTLAGILAPQGKAKALVYGLNTFFFIASVVMLVFAIVALSVGQPYGIWYGLLLPGALGTILFGGAFWLLGRRYRQAELRQMQAKNL